MSSREHARRRIDVLGTAIDAHSRQSLLTQVGQWMRAHESRYLCFCNAHSIVGARRDPAFARALAGADAALPDGMPIAWLMRRHGAPGQARLSGPDLMWLCCELAAAEGHAVYLLGADPCTLSRLRLALRARLPALEIAGCHSPPFRPLSRAEQGAILARIRGSGAALVCVGLGCPKQELWMAQVQGALPCVMLGVGAAFGFLAGTQRRAPVAMQRMGLEWLFRLSTEPRRLWRRYLATNALFIWYLVSSKASKLTHQP